MSQPVGYQYKSRIPSFSDDASIVEALKVYHYGVDNWTTEPIPNDSIEGNFRTLYTNVATINSQLSSLSYVQLVSQTSSPNVVTGQSITTVPITIRAIPSQTANLQQWQNSSSVNVGSISTGGFANLAGYITIGTTTQASTVGVQVQIINAAHKGIVVKAQASQSANLQEWQDSSGNILANLAANGRMYINGQEVVSGVAEGSINSFFLIGA